MKKLNSFYAGAALGVSFLAAPVQAENLLQNPQFKNGFSSWQHDSHAVTQATGGFNASSHAVRFLKGGTTSEFGRVSQRFSAVKGQKYKVIGEFKALSATGEIAEFGFSYPNIRSIHSSSGYQAFSEIGTASTTGLQRIEFAANNINYTLKGNFLINGDVLFSDAQVFDLSVPEVDSKFGAAPLALALGGLLLMSYQRRAKLDEIGAKSAK